MKPSSLLLAVLGASLAAAPAAAVEYPWCANFHDGAGTNCGFTTYEQCMLTARGSGGFCAENPFYTPATTARPRPKARRHRPAEDK